MALFTNLQSLSQTAGANPPDGSADAPSTIPTDLRLLGSFDAIMRDGGHQWGASVGGTDAIAITVNGISSLVAGQTFKFVAAGANTGAVTLNVNSLGAKSVKKAGNTALVAGEIPSLGTATVTYDGTNFQLLNVASPASLTTNGYRRDPSGVIEQWGIGTLPNTGSGASSVSVTLPIAWPTGLFAANATPSGGANSVTGGTPTMSATNSTLTTITFTGDTLGFANFNQAVTFYWRAIGR